MANDDFVGRRIGEFIVRERIGRGGMATVYRARQPSVNRDVALKVIRLDDELESQEFRRRFAQEAEVIAALEHIHILPIYSYGIDEDVAYLAMRLLRGGSLADLLEAGPLPLQRVVTLFGQFARGLAYAHSKGVIHRDLKPSNILLDDAGNAYLTDFGLAKLVGGESDLTQTGNVVGTPAYMSPEQLRGDPLDHRSDIYSVGVVLYHMVAGRSPFETDTSDVVAIIYKHLEQTPSLPSQVNPAVPRALDTAIMKALAKDPDDRFENMGEIAREVKSAVGIADSSSTYPEVSPELAQRLKTRVAITRQHRRNPLLFWGMVAVALALAVLVAVLAVTAPSEPGPFPQPTVIAGEIGDGDEAVPTQREVEIARRRVGEDGFIAYVACTQDSEFHSTQAREMRDFATEYGLNFRVYDSNADEYQQLTLIERARTAGAKGLIICPLDEALLQDTLSSAQQANIPLVFTADPENRFGGVALASQDIDYQMGLMVGRFAGKIIRDEMNGQADVILLHFPDMTTLVERANGLEEGILEFAPDASIIGRYLGATRQNGYNSVRRLIEDGIAFDVIASINDVGSFGAIEALEEAEIPPDEVVIASIDAEQLALQYIREGYYMRGSLSLSAGRTQTAQDAINAMTTLLGGGTIPAQIDQPIGEMITAEDLQAEEAVTTDSP